MRCIANTKTERLAIACGHILDYINLLPVEFNYVEFYSYITRIAAMICITNSVKFARLGIACGRIGGLHKLDRVRNKNVYHNYLYFTLYIHLHMPDIVVRCITMEVYCIM